MRLASILLVDVDQIGEPSDAIKLASYFREKGFRGKVVAIDSRHVADAARLIVYKEAQALGIIDHVHAEREISRPQTGSQMERPM